MRLSASDIFDAVIEDKRVNDEARATPVAIDNIIAATILATLDVLDGHGFVNHINNQQQGE